MRHRAAIEGYRRDAKHLNSDKDQIQHTAASPETKGRSSGQRRDLLKSDYESHMQISFQWSL